MGSVKRQIWQSKKAISNTNEVSGGMVLVSEFKHETETPESFVPSLKQVTDVNEVTDKGTFQSFTEVPFGFGSGFNDGAEVVIVDSLGRFYVGGSFSSYNGNACNCICRLLPNGDFDSTFAIGSGFNNSVTCIEIDQNGKIYVGGYFTQYQGATNNRIIRLNEDGSKDTIFDNSTGFNDVVFAMELAPDNDLFVGGSFTQYKSVNNFRAIRLNPNGSKRTTFNTGSGFTSGGSADIRAIKVDEAGNIYFGGAFNTYKGTAANNIVCLEPNGTIFSGFDYGSGVGGGVVMDIVIDSKGSIYFTAASYKGTALNGIAKVDASGDIDTEFVLIEDLKYVIQRILVDADDNLFVGLSFSTANIRKINLNGGLISEFNFESGFNDSVYGLGFNDKGNLCCVGYFITYKGETANRVILLDETTADALDYTLELKSKLAFNKEGNGIGTYETTNDYDDMPDEEIINKGILEERVQVFDDLLNSITDELPISAQAEGIASNGTTIVTDELQALINDNVGKKILIGIDKTAIFLIDKALTVPSNSILEINGEIKLADGNIRPLLANLSNGATTTTVTDAGTYFKVGQRIVISDDNQPVNGGGAWKTRKVGQTNVITDITGNTITFQNTFSNWFNGGVTTAANARIAQANNILILDGVSNVLIFGNGILNGNKANQFNIAGANFNRTAEDLYSSCGLTFNNASNLKIFGNLTIRDFVLHGISTSAPSGTTSTNCLIQGVTIDGVVDKSIAGLRLLNSLIDNCKALNGVDEGEIVMYNGCKNVIISNIFASNNRRYGVAITGQNNENITLHNLVLEDNRTFDLYVQNQLFGTNISNVTTSGLLEQTASVVINSCIGVSMKNIIIQGKNNSIIALSIGAGTDFATKSKGINIDGLSIINFTRTNSVSISLGDTENSVISNFVISNAINTFIDDVGNSNVVFQNGLIESTTSLRGSTYNDTFRFNNVKGQYVFETTGIEKIPIGQTTYFVNHGMAVTPKIQDLRIISFDESLFIDETSINARNFKVTRTSGSNVCDFRWECVTNLANNLGVKTYLNNYTSDFSAGVDGWGATRSVISGNNDGISDGTTSFDDVLKVYANNVSGTHELSKVMAVNAKVNKIRLWYYIPTGQTNVNGFRGYANVFGITILPMTGSGVTVGKWTEVSSADFTASNTNIIIRLMKDASTSFVGANDPNNDIVYFKFIYDDYID